MSLSRSVVEIVREAGFDVQPLGEGGVVSVGAGRRQAMVSVDDVRGTAIFGVRLPDLPNRFGRERALRNLLRVSFVTPYVKALSPPTGGLRITAGVPVEVLGPRIADLLLRSLALFSGMTSADLANDRRWGKRVEDGFTREISTPEDLREATRAIPALLKGQGLPATPGGTEGSFQTHFGSGFPLFVVLAWQGAVRIAALPGQRPTGDESAYMTRLLAVNSITDVAKVGLDPKGFVAYLYQVPRLTAEVLKHAAVELRRLDAGVRAVGKAP